MPFGLKLKKSRQYSVVSKSLFVVSVELLDGLVVECTLAVDSLAQECLDHVCQRLCIAQPELMGLRAVGSRGPRWIEPGRPLQRQLRKLSMHSPPLQLRVMYYPPRGSSPPQDETTRYHYFLQLKTDLVDGRLVCDSRQAVLLLAYSHQAEYGDYNERHTVDYFKSRIAFPKAMREGVQLVDGNDLPEPQLELLTAAVIHHHQTLRGLTQAQAEEGFITACQSLNGYGRETFLARDQSRQVEVEIAISLTGITITDDSEASKFYKWTDIKNVINLKRNFTIQCQVASESSSFTFSSAEDGKYVWRMCVLQHTYFMKHQQTVHIPGDQNPPSSHLPQPKFQNDGISDSRDDLDCAVPDKESSASVPIVFEAPGLKTTSYGGSQQGLQSEIGQPLNDQQRALSASCLDLAVQNNRLQSQNDLDKLRSLLPTYRPAPDYDTAVQQKYNQQLQHGRFSSQSHNQIHTNPMAANKPFIYGSQPEIHRPIHYPDVTRHTAAINRPVRHDDLQYGLSAIAHDGYAGFPLQNDAVQSGIHQQIHYLNVYKPPPPYPSNGLASNSTPDLAIASQSISPVGYHRGYISSHVSGSSPDLVSSRTLLNRQYLSRLHGGNLHNVAYSAVQNVMPSAHGTYENLASIMDAPNRHLIMEPPHHLTDHIQKVYDERGNIMYCVPATQVPYRSHMVLQHQKLNTVNDTQEPIYENVPLPWQNEMPHSLVTRNRAHSLTSVPEIGKTSERKVSQPISIMLNTNQNAQMGSQPGISSGVLVGAFNQNVQINNVKYSPDSHYVNAHILKSNNNISIPPSELKTLPSEKSINNDIQEIASSLQSISVNNKETTNEIINTNEVESNVSVKGSITGLNIPPKSPLIQKSDNNNITTITISTSEDVNQPYAFTKSHSGGYSKKVNITSSIHDTSQVSEMSAQHGGLDYTIPSSSYFDSSQQSSNFEMESSVNSSNASSFVKEKKKWRWGVFGGRNKTEVKSATLGRDKGKKNTANRESMEKRWSTANEKRYQPLPPSISKEAMCQLLERKMVDAQLSLAFERIPKGREINTDMTTALLPENSQWNAGNIEFLPYEDNRVRLTPTKINKYGYINASHITATVGSNQRFYVACSVANQGNNNSSSAVIFWQAVWETGARVVAYMCNNMASDYLPELLPGRTKDYGQYQVFVESSQASDYVVITRLRMVNGKSNYSNTGTIGQMRTVWHLQYLEWPDNVTVPKHTEHFLGFLEELSAVRQHCASEITPLHNANPPIFVACLQGAGRTGVTIAADLLLYTLEHNQELDIPRVISLLHQQRANLLQNVHQYRFIHGLLIYYLKQTRLI